MNHKTVVIEAEPRRYVPISQPNLVLHIGRRLHIPAMIGELKLLLRTGIELRRVGDSVLQVFTYRVENAVNPNLPVVPARVANQVPTNICFAVAAILRNDNRSRRKI